MNNEEIKQWRRLNHGGDLTRVVIKPRWRFHREDKCMKPGGEREKRRDNEFMNKILLEYHFKEIGYRLMYVLFSLFNSIIILWFYKESFLTFIIQPIISHFSDFYMIFTAPSEAIITYIKLVIIGGIMINIPYMVGNIENYLRPGLYKKEASQLKWLKWKWLIYYIGGVYIINRIINPWIYNYLAAYTSEEIQHIPKISEILDYNINILLILLTWPLIKLIPIDEKGDRGMRFILYLIIASIITPPDVISQIVMAGLLMIMTEGTIYLKILKKNTNRTPAERPLKQN